jgi:7,8-dihydropterin-6-yl-methyl-4-(beta-D-ribofuranosyl)aminobenzene 5'-phosphate synthase
MPVLAHRGMIAAGLVTALLCSAAPAAAQGADHRVKQLEIRILSTMLADHGFGEWGFAALVEVDGRKILFDTGAHEDTVQRNLKVLGLDLADVDLVILSHNHDDHTTGLLTLRRDVMARAPRALATAYAGRGLFWPRVDSNGVVSDRMAAIRKEYEATGARVVDVTGPLEILPGVWLTGPVPRVHPERNWSTLGRVRAPAGEVEDTVPEDMTLVVQTEQGPVYLFGCGHAGVVNTLELGRKAIDARPVKAVVGGVHLFAASDDHLAWTAGQFKAFGVQQFVGAHCTGIEAVYRIRALAGLTRETAMVGAVGATYSLARGIDAVRVAK